MVSCGAAGGSGGRGRAGEGGGERGRTGEGGGGWDEEALICRFICVTRLCIGMYIVNRLFSRTWGAAVDGNQRCLMLLSLAMSVVRVLLRRLPNWARLFLRGD